MKVFYFSAHPSLQLLQRIQTTVNDGPLFQSYQYNDIRLKCFVIAENITCFYPGNISIIPVTSHIKKEQHTLLLFKIIIELKTKIFI